MPIFFAILDIKEFAVALTASKNANSTSSANTPNLICDAFNRPFHYRDAFKKIFRHWIRMCRTVQLAWTGCRYG